VSTKPEQDQEAVVPHAWSTFLARMTKIDPKSTIAGPIIQRPFLGS
jgi:hypothetical protein